MIDPSPPASALDQLQAMIAGQRHLPVEHWDPPFCGDSGIRIAADGTWFHNGAPIRRPEMVRLFASVLRRDGAEYRLVTPVEKLAITVEDLPFQATSLETEGTGEQRRIGFLLNTGEALIAGPERSLVAADQRGLPALHVRGELWARIGRPVWYELCDLAIEEAHDPPGLWSDGCFFDLAGAQ